MNNADALKALQDYYDTDIHTADDDFKYTEALGYLIEETKDPKYMCELAWYYCSIKRFDLEIKYLEMAAEYGSQSAMEELGYMWYYGQHGEKDYKKAFYYFSKGADGDDRNDALWCKFKLADMYRFGCSVEKDEDRYRQMIEEAYEQVKEPEFLNEPFPEISLRLAGIRADQGRKAEAVKLLKEAKRFMAERITVDSFWGNIEVMGRIIRFMYQITPFKKDRADFYDLFYLTQKPGKYMMTRKRKKTMIEVVEENGENAIHFNGKWYRSFEEFCQKAEIDKNKITSIYDEFYDVEVAV